MRRLWHLPALAGLLLAAAAGATTIRRLSLEEVVAHSSEILVGTVTSTRAVEGGPPRNLVYTEVTFGRLEVLKGRVDGTSVTHRFAGGTLGNRTVEVVGVPSFAKGRRYVLLANPSLDWLCPAVGWWQGCYGVGTEAETGEEIVLDAAGRPVYGFEGGQPVTAPPDEEARPMRLAALLDRLRDLARRETEADDREGGEKPGERR